MNDLPPTKYKQRRNINYQWLQYTTEQKKALVFTSIKLKVLSSKLRAEIDRRTMLK